MELPALLLRATDPDPARPSSIRLRTLRETLKADEALLTARTTSVTKAERAARTWLTWWVAEHLFDVPTTSATRRRWVVRQLPWPVLLHGVEQRWPDALLADAVAGRLTASEAAQVWSSPENWQGWLTLRALQGQPPVRQP